MSIEPTTQRARVGRGVPLSPDEIDTARALLENGYRYATVASSIGRAEGSVRRHLPGYECATRGAQGRGIPLRPDELDRARALLEGGATYAAVARALGRSSGAIRGHFPEFGAASGRTGLGYRIPPEVLEEAEALLATGCSYVEVGRTLGHSPEAFRVRFPGMGWTRAQCGEHRQLLGEAADLLGLDWSPRYRDFQRHERCLPVAPAYAVRGVGV